MRTTIIFTLVFLCTFSLNAQYYYNLINPAGQNPGGLNNDLEEPYGAAGVTPANGYSLIIPQGTSALTWSAVQSIPFSFNFNGTAVTSYKVSNSGVLTFTTSATAIPSFTNLTIPNSSIPDNSIMVWGLQQSAGGSANDGVLKKTHGTAPNRQHWITFSSFGAPGASGSQWTYWGIVLEETTNKIYLVDLRTYATPLSLTLGIQINNTSAIQVTGAPNTGTFIMNGGTNNSAIDNVYYEFAQGSPPTDNAKLQEITVSSTEANNTPINITGRITNKGSNTLNSLLVNWTADGGNTINRDTLSNLNITSNGSATFSHAVNWVSPTAGQTYTLEVWIESPNGVLDQDPTDDSLSKDVFVILGNTVQKNALFEEFTTAGCVFCPDGAWVQEQIENNYQNVITYNIHSCFGSDQMTNSEATTLCSTLGNNSAPAGMVDRKLFDREQTVAFSRGAGYPNWQNSDWARRSLSQSQLGSAVDLNMVGSFNASNRSLTITVNASLVDYIRTGIYTVGLVIVEDSVSGTGNGWDQRNAYNNSTGHPYAGKGDPISNYQHRRVMRDILPGTWGAGNVIPANYSLNTTYSRTFTTTLPSAWDEDKIQLVAFAAYFGGTNKANYQIMNAVRGDMTLITNTRELLKDEASIYVYPNPSSNQSSIKFNLSSTKTVELELRDISGKVIYQSNYGSMSQGNQQIKLNVSTFAEGLYFLNLKIGDEIISKKLSIVR